MQVSHSFRYELGRKKCDHCGVSYPSWEQIRAGAKVIGWWHIQNGALRRRICSDCHKKLGDTSQETPDIKRKKGHGKQTTDNQT